MNCREFESKFIDLCLLARRNEGRYFAYGATLETINQAKKNIARELECFNEFPSNFILEGIAKLVLSTSYSIGGGYSDYEIKQIFYSLLKKDFNKE